MNINLCLMTPLLKSNLGIVDRYNFRLRRFGRGLSAGSNFVNQLESLTDTLIRKEQFLSVPDPQNVVLASSRLVAFLDDLTG